MEKLIYDIGMHNGRDTEFYLQKGFKVIAIEANPILVKKAKKKFDNYIETGQLIIIDKAISSGIKKEIEFYTNEEKDDWGTILPEWNRNMNSNYKAIKVKTIQLEKVIEKYGMPYYMKIDIEGADVICLQSLLKMNDKPTYLSIELLTPNNLTNFNNNSLDILSHLNVLGYTNFQISDQSKNSKVKCPKPSLEGNFVSYSFDGHSSGLFGKELQAPKFNIDKVAKMYLAYFYNENKTKDPSIIKILKKLKLIKKEEKNLFHSEGWYDIHVS